MVLARGRCGASTLSFYEVALQLSAPVLCRALEGWKLNIFSLLSRIYPLGGIVSNIVCMVRIHLVTYNQSFLLFLFT